MMSAERPPKITRKLVEGLLVSSYDAAGQLDTNGDPGTPTKQGQGMAPSVVISPSAPVSTYVPTPHSSFSTRYPVANTVFLRSMPLHPVRPRPCPEISLLPASPTSLIASKQPRKTCPRVFEPPNASILLDLIFPISVRESWRSFLGFTRSPLTAVRSSLCKRSISAISFSTSMTLQQI